MGESSERRSPSLQPGARISHYEILREIARGGAGVVYLGRDLNLGREVALKCVRPDLPLTTESRRRFLHEARAASKLSHPNVVTVYDVFEEAGTPWIAMEKVDGVTLRAALVQRGPLPVEEVLKHAEGLTDALRAAHEKHILHRDVTPNNILIARDGRARLTDFGLARIEIPPGQISGATTRSSSSQEVRLVGTPGYISPEQILGKPADPRSDLFSLGAVLYEMCAGRAAFAPAAQEGHIDAVLNREPMSLCRLNYDIPAELERIIRKAMKKRPDERFQSASDMLGDIRTLRRTIASGSQSGKDDPRPEPHWFPSIARWSLGAIVLVAAAGSAAWWVISARPEEHLPAFVPRHLTSGAGWESNPAVSPDGTSVAYVASDTSLRSDLWILDVRGGDPLRLTSDPAIENSPAWYPDGSTLAFASDRSGIESIWKVPRLGGSAVLVLPDGEDPAISPDGTRIAFARRTPSGRMRIHVAALAEPHRDTMLTGDPDGLWDHRSPAWSHDGRTLCYEDWRNLWLVPASGGKAHRLTTDNATDRDPEWSADDRFVYFSSYREGTQALWRIATAGGSPQRVTVGTGPEGQPSIARNGSILGYSTFAEKRDIVILDRKSGSRTRLEDVRTGVSPAFAPDMSEIIFSSNRRQHADLWAQPLSSGRPQGPARRLTESLESAATLSVSPDGLWVAFHRVQGGQRDIWIVPKQGGPAENFTNNPALDVHPAWSPDGGQIAFISDRDGMEHLWVAPVKDGRPAGPATRITEGDASEIFPAWSPKGQMLAFIRALGSDSEVYVVPAGGGVARRITSGAHPGRIAWETEDAMLVSGSWESPRMEIRRVRLSGGTPEALETPVVFGPKMALGDFSVSRDFQYIAYVAEGSEGDIWVLETNKGWR